MFIITKYMPKIEYKITSNFRQGYKLLKMDVKTGGRASAMLVFRKHKFLGSLAVAPSPKDLCLIHLGIPGTNDGTLIILIRKNATMFSRTIVRPYREFIVLVFYLLSLPPCVSLNLNTDVGIYTCSLCVMSCT